MIGGKTPTAPERGNSTRRKPRAWSSADDEDLRTWLGRRHSISDIAHHLNRTQDSVRGRAQVLGLSLVSRTRPWRLFPKRKSAS